MFNTTLSVLVDREILTKDAAPSHLIECPLSNVPDRLFKRKSVLTYVGILKWLKMAKL